MAIQRGSTHVGWGVVPVSLMVVSELLGVSKRGPGSPSSMSILYSEVLINEENFAWKEIPNIILDSEKSPTLVGVDLKFTFT